MCPLCNQPVPINRGEDPNNKVISGLIYGLLLASFPGPAQLPSLAVLQATEAGQGLGTASDGNWVGPGNCKQRKLGGAWELQATEVGRGLGTASDEAGRGLGTASNGNWAGCCHALYWK